ncbi:MAG: nucleoside triphosphate pyrophosphohydrolase [Stigonema ocellatum SAG 48.90 = DSM 106950]|nr:nucleoside triphosphate pyrophosphohydrolase [Stigonema ocellatum SAG 48.90 = DSM 106950]
MRKDYNKLVRDRIPEIIRRHGRECEVMEMSQSEYCQALREKLIEEAQEAATAEPEELVTELADLYEVIDTIMTEYGIHRDLLLAEQKQRRIDRGGFTKRIRLLWSSQIP